MFRKIKNIFSDFSEKKNIGNPFAILDFVLGLIKIECNVSYILKKIDEKMKYFNEHFGI